MKGSLPNDGTSLMRTTGATDPLVGRVVSNGWVAESPRGQLGLRMEAMRHNAHIIKIGLPSSWPIAPLLYTVRR